MISPVLKIFASLRLTVGCLMLALLLVCIGTLAQVKLGLYTAQSEIFRSVFVYWQPEGLHLRIPVFPGGWLLGGILLLNLLAAHAKRFELSRKKAGLFMIHGGLILLLLGQFFTELFQEESAMRLEPNQTKNYSEDFRKSELVVIDASDSNSNEVVSIPESILARQNQVQHPALPFTLEVKHYWANTDLTRERTPGSVPSGATEGLGLGLFVAPHPEATGMDERNLPSAVVSVISRKGAVGTWLISTLMGTKQTFRYEGKTYEIALRFLRHYLPFDITLIKFQHDIYRGTDIPKNFSSRIRLHNPGTGDDREVLIYMNNPLRYEGRTFFQAGFDEKNPGVTILQVVQNPAAVAPYVACTFMGGGLLTHFCMSLFSFLKRRRLQPKSPEFRPQKSEPGEKGAEPTLAGAGDFMKKWLPWIVSSVFAAWVIGSLLPIRENGFRLTEFGKLPVLLNGRVQPFDSVARNTLLNIHGSQTVRPPKASTDQQILSGMEWLMEAMTLPDQADQRKIFRIETKELRALVGANEGRLGQASFNDLTNQLLRIEEQARNIATTKKEAQLRTGYDKDLMHLYESLILYHRLKNTLQPEDTPDFTAELKKLRETLAETLPALKKNPDVKAQNESSEIKTLAIFFNRYQELSNYAYGLMVPPESIDRGRDDWKNVGASLMESFRTGRIDPGVNYIAKMTTAYRERRIEDFNKSVRDYRNWMAEKSLAPELKKGAEEAFFNHMEPFYKSMVIYVAALLLGCAFWLNLSEPVRRAAFQLLVLAFVIHTLGLVFRMYLEHRPPVTNLYSSAIFVGWGAVILGIILERIFGGGVGIVAAATVGFVTQIIAHHLSLAGDTMEMLRAVLDTNLWLSTHVVAITTGYASMFAAGLLAIIYVLRGFFTPTLLPETGKNIARMIYGIVCFATLFSFVGTILGGIWADQSWGRFWGWDPKENGALLIVLWNAAVLHARWGRMIGEKGLVAMALFGNVITSFSWFGVNMLGVGLHSYGFMDAAFKWLMLFVVSQMLLIALTLVPSSYWSSFRKSDGQEGGLANALSR